MPRPQHNLGMRHVALNVDDVSSSEHFYVELLGMQVEWRPDADNVYLTSGPDNVALHRSNGKSVDAGAQRLDHIGFILETAAAVDAWHDWLSANGVTIKAVPRTHRDGARSFYCMDPDGITVQMIYHPPIVDHENR